MEPEKTLCVVFLQEASLLRSIFRFHNVPCQVLRLMDVALLRASRLGEVLLGALRQEADARDQRHAERQDLRRTSGGRGRRGKPGRGGVRANTCQRDPKGNLLDRFWEVGRMGK